MRACPNCGELLDDAANFCHMCGDRLMPEPAPIPVDRHPSLPEDSGPRFPRMWIWLLASLAGVIVIALGSMLLLDDSGEDVTGSGAPPAPSATASSVPSVVPSSDPREVLASTESVRITVTVSNCSGCEITAIPADEAAHQTATVEQDAAEFAVPATSTLGLAFTISHPGGFGSAAGPNVVVLAPVGAQPGLPVTVGELIDATAQSLCWSGTTQADVTIPIRVDPFSDGTPAGGLRAWADPAQSVLAPTAIPAPDGTVEQSSLKICRSARNELAQ